MFRLKQYIKMLLQNVLLPALYELFRHRPVRKGSVIFADAHHAEMPFSMQRMYEAVQKLDETYEVELFICDFAKIGFAEMLRFLVRFMKQYATAEYVFICDYFLPASSCCKRTETKLIQLWHSCGLMKKIAFDTGEDIPAHYRGDLFGNYSLLTMSAQICCPVHARALRLAPERIRATGISRTDYYFDPEWNRTCQEAFYRSCPEAKGKKIALWAPTFRGNAAKPYLAGLQEIQEAAQNMQEDWYFLIKAHPHIDAHGQISNCSIPTEELLCVADVLITDYSSILFDYLLYQKPAVLFASDLNDYTKQRGFYLDYETVPFPHAVSAKQLQEAVETAEKWYEVHRTEIDAFRVQYTGACDGSSTQRILDLIGMQSGVTKQIGE